MFNFDTAAPADLFADMEPATPAAPDVPAPQEEPKELKKSATDLKTDKRIHVGKLKTNNRNKIDYLYLNETKADVEKWTVQLTGLAGTGSISLTYGVKEFSILASYKSVHSDGTYLARFTGIKRKAVEGLNHITLNMQLLEHRWDKEKLEFQDYLVTECINEVDWPKGKPLHELWEALANSVLELLLGVETRRNNDLLLSGRLA